MYSLKRLLTSLAHLKISYFKIFWPVFQFRNATNSIRSKLEHVFAAQNDVKSIIDRLELHSRVGELPSPSRAVSPPHKHSRGERSA